MTLDDLKPGQRARITAVDDSDPAIQRLMTLGLVETAELMLVRRSLSGDPLEVALYGASMSVRRADARRVQVSCD